MNEIYFLIQPVLKDASNLNWQAVGVGVSAVASSITMVALITTWIKTFSDNNERRSLFYLKQIKYYFSIAVSLLSERKNNNVKWHRAIEALKTADDLRELLKDKSHQNIYVADYLDTAFGIIDVIKDIDDFKFFYGIADYKDKEPSSLYQENNSESLEKPRLSIAPEALLCLCVFIDKANRAFHDTNHNESTWENVFNSEYFKVLIRENAPITEFTKTNMKIVLDYIKDYRTHQNLRTRG